MLAIENNAALNMGLQTSLQRIDSVPLIIYPEMGLLGHMVVLLLVVLEDFIPFSII